ncbi:MAG: septum formation initiator family protein [Bdellovibrionaceae bacterium]|nr:septum formation initiator family protein [Pseudobdellovibrionaceae bacterium]
MVKVRIGIIGATIERVPHSIRAFRHWLQNPGVVFVVSASIAFGIVLLDGTLFRIWSLDRDRDRLEQRIEQVKGAIVEKERQIKETGRAEFIERQARERLDLVREGDLVFVFSN